MTERPASASALHSISVVVPVYAGELTLPQLLAEIAPFTSEFVTPAGYRGRCKEHGPVVAAGQM